MTGLILATHGTMASAALDVAQMLMGEQEAVQTIGFHMGDSLELLLQRFAEAFAALDDCEDILVVTDIRGGSPCNAATVMKTQHENARVIAGLSIPILVQFFENRENAIPFNESVDAVIEVGQASVGEVIL